MRRNSRGFSLIEVMVVIAIIAALAATTTVLIKVAQGRQRKTETQGRLNSLGAAIESLAAPDNLGFYPPTLTTALVGRDGQKWGQQVGLANETNIGIETVYVAVRLPGLNVPLGGIEAADCFSNTDEDEAGAMIGKMQKPDLLEYCDAWGRPFVYLHNRDYRDPSKVEQYVLPGQNAAVKVAPMKVAATGEFFRADSFQLFSLGEDGKPGTEDDLHYGR